MLCIFAYDRITILVYHKISETKVKKKWNIFMFRTRWQLTLCSQLGMYASLSYSQADPISGRANVEGLILDFLLPLMCSLPFVSSTVLKLLMVVWSADPVTGLRLSRWNCISRPTPNLLFEFMSSSILPSPSHHVYVSSVLTGDFLGMGFYLPFQYIKLSTLGGWTHLAWTHVTSRKSWNDYFTHPF